MKILKLTIASALFLTVGMVRWAYSDTFVYTDILSDPTFSGTNTIIYTLVLTPLTASSGSAVLTVQNLADVGPPEYWAGEFDFKFHGGSNPGTISSLSGPGSTGPWAILDNTHYMWRPTGTPNKALSASAVGFAVNDLICTKTGSTFSCPGTEDFTKGLPLTGSPATSSFSFNYTLFAGQTLADSIPFQVMFYGQDTTRTYWSQLSRTLNPPVPEPGTLVLMGLGLVGLGVARRRRK